jgi:hypothetical protein
LRLPSVWFYVDNLTVVDMISRFLTNAQSRLKLSAHWHLQVAYGSDAVAFAVTPDHWRLRNDIKLQALQEDLMKLARELRKGISGIAARELNSTI